ncbi:unnamed protein product [Colias eurytheme]|nr:unnamed protein product [Colias eurytheme]
MEMASYALLSVILIVGSKAQRGYNNNDGYYGGHVENRDRHGYDNQYHNNREERHRDSHRREYNNDQNNYEHRDRHQNREYGYDNQEYGRNRHRNQYSEYGHGNQGHRHNDRNNGRRGYNYVENREREEGYDRVDSPRNYDSYSYSGYNSGNNGYRSYSSSSGSKQQRTNQKVPFNDDFYKTFPYPELVGRTGIGFQKRTRDVNGFVSPLTRELLQVVGKPREAHYNSSHVKYTGYHDSYGAGDNSYQSYEYTDPLGKNNFNYKEHSEHRSSRDFNNKFPEPGVVGRTGIGFQKRTAEVNGIVSPLTKDLLETVGKPKDMYRPFNVDYDLPLF